MSEILPSVSGEPLQLIRTMHPYGFRCGEWAVLRCVVPDPERDRYCYLVEFGDGVTRLLGPR